MNLKMFFLIIVFCFTGYLFADNVERDKLIWNGAYRGHYSLVHKLVLSRKAENINDEMINHFAMAYLYYRMGNLDGMYRIFEGIDYVIGNELSLRIE